MTNTDRNQTAADRALARTVTIAQAVTEATTPFAYALQAGVSRQVADMLAAHRDVIRQRISRDCEARAAEAVDELADGIDWSSHVDVAEVAAEIEVDAYDVARHLDVEEIASEVDVDSIAERVDLEEVAGYLCVDEVAGHVDLDALANVVADRVADRLARRIADALGARSF